jgi:hypothetical protein
MKGEMMSEQMGRFSFDGAEGIAFWVGNSDEEPTSKVMFSELPTMVEFLRVNLPGLFTDSVELRERDKQ